MADCRIGYNMVSVLGSFENYEARQETRNARTRTIEVEEYPSPIAQSVGIPLLNSRYSRIRKLIVSRFGGKIGTLQLNPRPVLTI